MSAGAEVYTRTVKVLDAYERAALVRDNDTGREGWISLAHADLSPAGPLHVLTVSVEVARDAGLLPN
ncbi:MULTISPECIES: hypothetical protein [unclassified Mesorhizobium]|uniref:hypothetical protein n=1 Tax=unclassified Mesorhizobium TaxID=325217 RepID=UPI0012059718|nr:MULTISPECIES: hypothetical protein [unclassified Mesorhizobium]MBZ9821935.1 hypothetical protein [Mesorhizobium sp. CA4]TIV60306.1 MAG: hypothetical protein E5V80_10170 [Mesorhizobium sp.]